MKHHLLSLLLSGQFLIGFCQLTVNDIPAGIMNGADAVLLFDEGEFTVTEDDHAFFKVKQRIAILNGEGRNRFAVKALGYDKLVKVKSFKAELFDQFGKSIKQLKKSEIQDVSAISGFSIYEDNRLKVADLRQAEYPFIVEFEFELEYKYLYHIPNWRLLPGDEVGVMKSTFRITSPKEYEPRYKVMNIEDRSERSENDEQVVIDFAYENLEPIISEPHKPKNVHPEIVCSPSKFRFEDYEGDLSTWESFGHFQNSLNNGLDNLPLATARKMKELTKPYITTEDKARAIYNYLQENTRYVSIQLGIGGWQPFSNSIVDEYGYGDCKALSFYTQSLLKSVGIESHYTIVYSGSGGAPELDPNFSNTQFNHVILCVPNKGDTLWLECTSQTNPFGYAGRFTGNRDVLLVTEDGGKLARTPYYAPEVNTQTTTAQIEVDANFNSSANVSISYAGLQYENGGINYLSNKGDDEQVNWIQRKITVPGLQLTDFNIENNKEIIPSVNLDFEFNSSKLFNNVGSRYFIQPNLFTKETYVPDRDNSRKYDISINMGYVDMDTITFNIPELLRPEFLPEPTTIESEFGTYTSSLTYENGILTYIRKVMIKDGTFDKGKYEAFRNFRKSIVRADKQKIAFIKRT